jgi:hypothetical protein
LRGHVDLLCDGFDDRRPVARFNMKKAWPQR